MPVLPQTRLPDLRIVPSESLLLHENSDPRRVQRLARMLVADGVLRNPPVVAAVDSGEHVVLDGANRVTAIRQIGCPDQLVQVVDYDTPAVRLDVWAHLVFDEVTLPADRWLTMTLDGAHAGLENGTLACAIVTDAGARGLAATGLPDRVRALASDALEYRTPGAIYRVLPSDLATLRVQYGAVRGVVLFAPFTKDDILTIARLPIKLPSGITRHVIQNRALRVNADLSLLREPMPIDSKQARLNDTIKSRVDAHGIRHYEESTVLFDE